MPEFYEKYARGFDNRTTVAVNIASEVAGEYYAVYFGNPYDGESLVKQPALTGFTPVSTTLDVPKDVERLYVVAQGEMKSYEVGNLSISAAARPGPQTRRRRCESGQRPGYDGRQQHLFSRKDQ